MYSNVTTENIPQLMFYPTPTPKREVEAYNSNIISKTKKSSLYHIYCPSKNYWHVVIDMPDKPSEIRGFEYLNNAFRFCIGHYGRYAKKYESDEFLERGRFDVELEMARDFGRVYGIPTLISAFESHRVGSGANGKILESESEREYNIGLIEKLPNKFLIIPSCSDSDVLILEKHGCKVTQENFFRPTVWGNYKNCTRLNKGSGEYYILERCYICEKI